MPSVGSTPTTTSPAQQSQHQHPKLQQQHSLPLQLQQYQQQHYQPLAIAAVCITQHVTTTQPSPAGVINSTTSSSGIGISNCGDISPLSSSNSFSSVDTNQTLLNSIANPTQMQQHTSNHHLQKQRTISTSSSGRGATTISSNNRMYNTKYSQFMIITPAVSIDRDFEHTLHSNNRTMQHYDDASYYNGNIFRTSLLQSSVDSGNSSDSSGGSGGSFRSNYNPYLHNSRQHLLSKSAASHSFYTFPSWRWCTLICAAMRCFGGGRNSTNAPPSSVFTRPPYQRSRSSGGHRQHRHTSSHRRLRPSTSFTAETAFEHFSAPFAATPRKTRDHLNNITYEL